MTNPTPATPVASVTPSAAIPAKDVKAGTDAANAQPAPKPEVTAPAKV